MMQIATTEGIWDLVENFFRARAAFEEQYQRCGSVVRASARRARATRGNARLCAQEVSQIFNLKALEELRNNYLGRLREISHHIFRRGGSVQLFDKYVSDLYHEVSILKEQQYAVEVLAAGEKKDLKECEEVLDEVHEFYPRKMKQIRNLFLKAQEQIELLMKAWNREKALVRSLYLFADGAVGGLYEGGVEGLYKAIYPLGASEGYLVAAECFANAYFGEQAIDALRKAKRVLKESGLSEGEAKEIRRRVRDVEKIAKSVSA